jgi:hypothetical protein
MCEFSLHQTESRPARVSERLITTVFYNTTTHGFSNPRKPKVAVCLLPGTELMFTAPVREGCSDPLVRLIRWTTRACGFSAEPKPKGPAATFVQVNLDDPCEHHDAIKFSDDTYILLTDLEPGQLATVLTLPSDPQCLQGKAREKAETEQHPVLNV